MQYCLYVDEKGEAVWGKETLEDLFENPRDCTPLMNSDATVAPTQIMLGEGCHVWELVRSTDRPDGIVVVKDGQDDQVDFAALVPNSIHDLRPEGVSTLLGVRRGENGFESIGTGKPIRTIGISTTA